ncbi:MAG: nicotinamide-nucleotide adenylyltransferase [Candidatus Bathyarchaeia archaeon]
MRALFIGRFQPFHNGHLEALKYILERAEEVIVAIGSAQYSHDLENPFTAGERVSMIAAALEEAGIGKGRCHLIPVEDVNVHDVWVSHVRSRVPKFDVVYTNEALTTRLFKEAGVKTEKIPLFNRGAYSATEIRRRILKGLDWKALTPPSVFRMIKEIGGDERIRELSLSDKIQPVEL